MKNFPLLKVLTAIVTCVALGSSPHNAGAQRGGRGGHGGSGGFRGSGVGMGFRGGGLHSGGGRYGYGRGHSYAGHPGGPFYGGSGYRYGYLAGRGWHGGHNGWHGGYWWYPYHGWGFAWPYWVWGWRYTYYGYSPWYYAPYPYYFYKDDCPPGYSCPTHRNDDPPPANSSPKPGHDPAKPAKPEKAPPDMDDGSSYDASRFDSSVLPTERVTIMAVSYRVADSSRGYKPVRPELQTAMRALREMPPFARLREIETGRYSHFTAEERALLRDVK